MAAKNSGKETGVTGDSRNNQDHPDHNTVKEYVEES